MCDGIGDGNDDPNDGDSIAIFDPCCRIYISVLWTDGAIRRAISSGWLGHYYYELIARVYFTGLAYALEPKPSMPRMSGSGCWNWLNGICNFLWTTINGRTASGPPT